MPLYRKWFLRRIESDAERRDSHCMCTDNPQEREDFIEVASKDQESESTEADPNPLLLLLSPSLKAVCSKLISNYPEMMGDTDKWTLSLRGFMLG